MVSFIVIALLAAIDFKQFKYCRDVKISSKTELWEVLLYLVILVICLFPAVKNGNFALNMVVYVLAIGYAATSIFSQGLTENGVLIAARGKKLYLFSEISKAELKAQDEKYFQLIWYYKGAKIAKQLYSCEKTEEIKALLQRNNVHI